MAQSINPTIKRI